MTNREMILFATSIIFASTTVGLVLQGAMHHHMRPGFEGGPRGGFSPHGQHDQKFDMFAKVDTDKDGFVTKDEMLAGQKARLDDFFANADTNHDGKLSRDEMEKGRELMRARFEAKRSGTGDTQTSPTLSPAPDAPAADQPTPAAQ